MMRGHMGLRQIVLLVVAWVVMVHVGSKAVHGLCAGDCNRDGEVTVDEIVLAVNSALGVAGARACAMADQNADGEVTIDEIVAAVQAALGSCPAVSPTGGSPSRSATPVHTATASATASPTPTAPPTCRRSSLFPTGTGRTWDSRSTGRCR